MRPSIALFAGVILFVGLPALADHSSPGASESLVAAGATLASAAPNAPDVLDGTPAVPAPEKPASAATPESLEVPRFVPPPTDKPAVRLRSASSRTAGETWPQVYALVPEQPGQTVFSQPSLFWYVDEPPPAGAKTLFTLIRDSQDVPVAELEIDTPERAGFHRIRLADYGVMLSPGIDYEWSIALVVDSERWSRNPYAVGGIERVADPASLASRLAAAGSAGKPHAYAELGLWYDALTVVSNMADAAPDDPGPIEMRSALLKQVGLGDISEAR
jgi:hypothetical protein